LAPPNPPLNSNVSLNPVQRIFFGFLVCALIYPCIALLGGGAHAIGGAFAVATITVPITLLAGVPLFLFLRNRGWLGLWKTVGAGAAAGILASTPFAFTDWYKFTDWYAFIFVASYFVPVGAMHALIFWFVAVYRNEFLQSSQRSNA